ncbi:hydrolase, alpha/beta domain protein [Ancylostoma ceylanicum]|uniref:Hydrolase, alpha/beta domain protein n=1 Tax=Ancylostoma ceylanicum TaxID=53326 RepID=A0A0D6MAB5_9BILA|nr:hydrolase, alpha/beta domain protein [Ancylostoma ceylanicum]
MWLLLYWATVVLFFVTALFLLYIPLPPDISDRKKLQILEFLLRIGYEYPVTNESIGGTKVRVYTPKEKKTNAALVFIHGGGWATMRAGADFVVIALRCPDVERKSYFFRDSDCYDDLMYKFVRRLGITVFSIDYRLAPEYPFPYPVDDCEAVVNDLYHDSYTRFNIDRDKICIAGDSAGGNLAAVVTQRLARRNENFLKCQVLIYPVIHVFSFQLPSYLSYYEKYNGTSLLNPRAMARWILLYLGLPANKRNVEKLTSNQHISKKLYSAPEMQKLLGSSTNFSNKNVTSSEMLNQEDEAIYRTFATKGTDPDVSPLFGVSKDLPPALVLTAEFDILRDEGIQYAMRLKEEGVPCDWKHYKTAFHGVCNMPYSLVRRDMSMDVCNYLRSFI